jgi:feruloyl esterase
MGSLKLNIGRGANARGLRLPSPLSALLLAAVIAPFSGGGALAAVAPPRITCDDSMKSGFRPDADTTVVAVKAFKKGERLTLGGAAASPAAGGGGPGGGANAVAANDICMVKLVVGPGNAGPAQARSTSPGIGIEVWLPTAANWNKRIHVYGGGGWAGGEQGLPAEIGSPNAAATAGGEGAVSAATDGGHAIGATGDFAMNPDGSLNSRLYEDFASRSLHQMALKTKALAAAYYGEPAKYAYWQGGSTGGRQGLNLAQNHPEDFDGIIALYPAIHWTRFITGELYPQIVMQRDLGGKPLSLEQLDLASNAAIGACDRLGGQHLGYVLDPSTCTYDPTTDRAVLCPSDGGRNTTPACLTRIQARAINKIWYGMTANGQAPSPRLDNGWSRATTPAILSGNQRWFGLNRGTLLGGRAGPRVNGLVSPLGAFVIASDMVALELLDSTLADDTFINAKGNGRSLWKGLSYAQLSEAYDRGVAMQRQKGFINTENPDLTPFARRGGKILTWHGLADELIPPQGTINYYNRVADRMGGMDKVQDFYRLYIVPGLGHGSPNGTSNPDVLPPNFGPGQLYSLITDWVEKGVAPGDVELRSNANGVARSMPGCLYPKKARYRSGDPKAASSYTCS